jgi:hypothetical protein
MSTISHVIRSFSRFELKYMIDLEAAAAFRAELAQYLRPDTHGNGDGIYPVSSLYYDSPGYRCYWEKMDGIKVRRKLRVRYYGVARDLGSDTPVFAEIKQRIDRATRKRRVMLPYRDALALCTARQPPECGPRDQPVINEIHTMTWSHNLRPASVVTYMRQAYVGTDYDIGLRVTFDTDLRYRVNSLTIDGDGPGHLLAPPHLVVMEIKVNDRIPYWLTELVARHDFRLTRISKYCKSLEAGRQVPLSLRQALTPTRMTLQGETYGTAWAAT